MEHKWENNIKIELPEFHGSLNPDEFINWLNTIEQIFDYGEVSIEKKVKLVAIRLKGRASTWWEQLQLNRCRCGKEKIHDWEKMKKKLKGHFLPFNYLQSVYLKQDGSVNEYTKAFYQFITRADLSEREEQRVARYVSGLKSSIQDVLALHTLHCVSEASNRALAMEKQQSRHAYQMGQHSQGGFRDGFRPGPSTPSFAKSNPPSKFVDKGASFSQAPRPNGAFGNQNTPQGGTFKCFRCDEPGHRSSDCRKNMGNNRNKALLIEEVEEHGDFEDAPIFDPLGKVAIGGDSDEEESLALFSFISLSRNVNSDVRFRFAILASKYQSELFICAILVFCVALLQNTNNSFEVEGFKTNLIYFDSYQATCLGKFVTGISFISLSQNVNSDVRDISIKMKRFRSL
ncbi:unnamed protein product [Camellia sinensis]